MIWNCKDFRKDLMVNKEGPIKKELNLSLEELTKLSGHDEIKTAWGDLKKVVSSIISIQKINKYRTWISSYGVDWYKEYYNDEGNKDKVNPVRLIAEVWSNSDKIGFDCEKKTGEWGQYFDECGKTAVVVEGKNAKIVRVLKPTNYRDGSYFVPIKTGHWSWASNGILGKELERRHSRELSSTGKLGTLIYEPCNKHWGWLDFGKGDFCKQLLEKFFGDDVSDKRYCL